MERDQFKCHCGCTVGLACFDDRWWCATCLWKEVETLRAQRAGLRYACKTIRQNVESTKTWPTRDQWEFLRHNILVALEAAIAKATEDVAKWE